MNSPTIALAISEASKALHDVAGSSAAKDSELLLCKAMEVTRSHLFAWPDKMLTPDQTASFAEMIERRLLGEPTAYILGNWEFWSLPLAVTSDTLIPRPETELLVETALEYLPSDKPASVADLGTGSGAIALAIASERPLTSIIATDKNEKTLLIAEQNAQQLGISNIVFSTGSWLQPLKDVAPMDLIVSNPPYIAENDPHLVRQGLPWEPNSALVSGPDGLSDIRQIIQDAKSYLKPGGHLIIEHGYQQAQALQTLFSAAQFTQIRTLQDLENRDRITLGRRPTP